MQYVISLLYLILLREGGGGAGHGWKFSPVDRTLMTKMMDYYASLHMIISIGVGISLL